MVKSMPSAKDVFEYRRSFARVLDLPYNRQELIINLAPAAALYKRLVESTEGYAGEVPIIAAGGITEPAAPSMYNS